MKIEHEMKSVRIVRHHTIADALMVGLSKYPLDGLSNRIFSALHLNKPTVAEQELAEMLYQPLWREYEGETVYERTLALISLDMEIGVHEFYQELVKNDCYPASFSEGMSYLPVLVASDVMIDAVLHLGTSLRDEKWMEYRLLTREKGNVELIHFYSAMKLKSYYRTIVVKEEKKQVKN